MYEPSAPGEPAAAGGYASISAALDAAQAALAFAARANATPVPFAELAASLRVLERAGSALVAARASVLAAFTAQAGYAADGHGTVKSWLAWQTRVTGGAAGGAVGWMRRLPEHRAVADALAAGVLSESWARKICQWSDLLPGDCRKDADQILLAAATGGAALADLAALADEMFRRTAPPGDDDDDDGSGGGRGGQGDDGFGDRGVRLDLHYRGAGHLTGDLTPGCAAALMAVLEALGKKAGPEDDRTTAQRHHDALEEAARLLTGSGGLPDTAGQPTSIQLHMTLDQLRRLAGQDDARAGSASGAAGDGAWLAARGTGAGQPGWLPDADAAAFLCDAAITPVVCGHLDPAALAKLTSDILAELRGGAPRIPAPRIPGCPAPPGPDGLSPETMARLSDLLLRSAAGILSGPGGLASALRAGILTGLPAASLPLDVGRTRKIPGYLRNAVILRHPRCAFPGCRRRARHCQIHHLIPWAEGGATELGNLVPLCSFHHQVAIHRWGWTLILNPDGTTTATSPDRKRTWHSNAPPATTAA